jgi:hypothetical protein
MNKLAIALLLSLSLGLSLIGCESEQHKAQVAADMKNLSDDSKGVLAALQWELDDEYAQRVFANDEHSVENYMTFRKCHEEPPTKEANKKVCAALQIRVARAEAKADAQAKREKAKW